MGIQSVDSQSPFSFLKSRMGFTIRFALLRITCLSALCMFGAMMASFHVYRVDVFTKSGGYTNDFGNTNILHLIFVPIIVVHHLASAFGRTLGLPGLLDFCLLVAEFVVLVYSFRMFPRSYTINFSNQPFMVISTTICLASLGGLILIRLADFVLNGLPSLWRRYDITKPGGTPNGPSARTPKPISVIFGRSLWKENFPGETRWIIVLRALLSLATLGCLAVYAAVTVIAEPLDELRYLSSREYRANFIPTDATPPPGTGWNVLVDRISREGASVASDRKFHQSVIVKALDPTTGNSTHCKFEGYKFSNTGSRASVVIFYCPSGVPITPSYFNGDVPEFYVSVNFSNLVTSGHVPMSQVRVALAATNDTSLALYNTEPTLLIPGVNLIGTIEMFIRQTLQAVGATLLSEDYDTTFIAKMTQAWPDPRPFNQTVIPNGKDFATIRIAIPNPWQWRIVADYRNKSVLRGIASVGGLWTFLGGIFTAFFGSSLMRIIFGIKPLSVLGILHNLQQDRLRKACATEYPQLEHDVNTAPPNRGLLNVLCDHLMDVDFLARTSRTSRSHQSRYSMAESLKPEVDPDLEVVLLRPLPASSNRSRRSLASSMTEFDETWVSNHLK